MKNLRINILTIVFAIVAMSANAQIEGYWKGKIDLGVQQLEMAFDITSTENGYSATLDVPAQGVFDMPVDETVFQDNRLQITLSALGASYSGVLKDKLIEGEFTQQGMTLPMNLEKGEKETQKARPQDPQPPFNYRINEVIFRNEKEGFDLTGTLTIPEGDGPFPAMVLVSGSGQENRDEELMNHRPFWVIADYCARHGVAVLRYDDRGVGGSGGEVATATSMDFSYDAEAAFDYLRSQAHIDASRVGILGHSEGGIINFMVSPCCVTTTVASAVRVAKWQRLQVWISPTMRKPLSITCAAKRISMLQGLASWVTARAASSTSWCRRVGPRWLFWFLWRGQP